MRQSARVLGRGDAFYYRGDDLDSAAVLCGRPLPCVYICGRYAFLYLVSSCFAAAQVLYSFSDTVAVSCGAYSEGRFFSLPYRAELIRFTVLKYTKGLDNRTQKEYTLIVKNYFLRRKVK